MARDFGWEYPPGVTGMEPEIADYPEDEDGNPIEIDPADFEPDWDAIYKEQRESGYDD